MRVLVSLYMWTVWVLSAVICIPFVMAAIALLPRKKAYVIVQAWCYGSLWLSGIRTRVHGAQNLPTERPFVLMGNHINLLDPFIWCAVMPDSFVGVEKKENFKIPLYGWLMRRWGNVPIDRKDLEQAKRDLATAAEVMRRDKLCMVVLPEGTRTRDGRIGPFKKGGFHLALGLNAPIIPITVNGAFAVQARGKFVTHPGVIDVVIGKPIDTASYGVERLEDLMHDVRAAILEAFTGDKSELDPSPVPHLVTHGDT
jgi:1-acyl-sn-glycerol-3-phosphate acyltransferase